MKNLLKKINTEINDRVRYKVCTEFGIPARQLALIKTTHQISNEILDQIYTEVIEQVWNQA